MFYHVSCQESLDCGGYRFNEYCKWTTVLPQRTDLLQSYKKKPEFELAAIAEYLFQICAKHKGGSIFVLHFSLCKEQYNNMLLAGFVYKIDFLPLPK